MTNEVQTIGESIQANPQLNDAIVSVLTGVKNAGGEIYAASKTAIASSVDFLSQQTPQINDEFLRWKTAEALLYIGVFLLVLIIAIIVAKLISKGIKTNKFDNDDTAMILMWVLRIVPLVAFIICLSVNSFTIIKIKVAPRVYLIEYVVSYIK